MCFVEKHKKHECADIKESAKNFTEQLKNDMEKVESCALKYREKMNMMDLDKKSLLETLSVIQEKISERYAMLQAKIQSHQIQLLERLHSFKDGRLKEIESRKDETEKQFVIFNSFKQYSQELRDKGSACEISRAANDLHIRTEELVNSPEVPGDNPFRENDNTFTPSLVTNNDIRNWIGELSLKG